MYVIVSTFLALYHGVTENIYSRKFYVCKNKWFIHNYLLKTFVTESAV